MKRSFFRINLAILSISSFAVTVAFDYEYYASWHNLPKEFHYAMKHFVRYGMPNNIQSTKEKIKNTNFDWEYYRNKNKL